MESKNVVLVNECGNIVGVMDKLEAHNSDTPLHKGFSLFLFDSESHKLVLQKRNSNKKVWPGFWSNSVCGHQQMGEITSGAVLRCAKFELGLSTISNLRYIFTHKYHCSYNNIMENEICDVFVGVCDSKVIKPNSNEVEDLMLIDWHEFIKEYDTIGVPYWCKQATLYLANNEEFQQFLKVDLS